MKRTREAPNATGRPKPKRRQGDLTSFSEMQLPGETRIVESTRWSSQKSGSTSRKVKVRLPPELPEPQPPRILFTSEELNIQNVPDWPAREGDAEGDAEADDFFSAMLTVEKSDRPKAMEDPMSSWREQIDEFLDELLRLEGRGDYASHGICLECHERRPEYRCSDCSTDELYCSSCVVALHKRNPLHRIEKWTQPGFFIPTTLSHLGLRIQLGHRANERCPAPAPTSTFTILDTCGIHEVHLDFCGCEKATHHVNQLLRARLYPATTKSPRTAATFNLLKRYELLSFESKCSAYQYYQSIVRESDNTGLLNTKTRYREFLRMTRCWGALKTFKRAGRAHYPSGVSGTLSGGCAVLCPACPQPGINLPDNWREAPKSDRWLYALFLGIDANFRLRRKHISSNEKDPAINQGYGYFVKSSLYQEHLQSHAGVKQEPSKCVSHDAVNSADTKKTQGCAVTGCGAVDCARHEFRRPNAVGDLQKGERYLNMDYLFYSSLANTSYNRLVVSYDIACQWKTKFYERMSQKFPGDWFVNQGNVDITFLVPKFHLPAHIEKCHREYSFNLTKGVGRTDGEGVERGWSRINDLASSTREMGPGARQDKLECHMGDSNWKKKTKLGEALLEKIKNAISSRSEQAEQLCKMEEELEKDWLIEWRREVEAWEEDSTRPNPYEPRIKEMSQNDVRLMLAKQDANRDTANSYASAVSDSGMLILGLELEDAQQRLRTDLMAAGLHPTSLQQAKYQERCNVLSRRLEAWFPVQAYFVPGVTLLRTLDAQRERVLEPRIFDKKLYLPSEIVSLKLPDKLQAAMFMDPYLMQTEWILREAQAKDALNSLRSHLRVDSYLHKYKQMHARGVSENTRSQILVKQNLARVKSAVIKYRKAYQALVALEGPLKKGLQWRNYLHPLEDKDVIGLPVAGVGEGNRTLSWIWFASGVSREGDGEKGEKVQDVLRIQWLRARARVDRWSEEIKLLLEEMRRVKMFLESEAAGWGKCCSLRSDINPELKEGLVAYATHQAHIRLELQGRFSSKWANVGRWVECGVGIQGSGSYMDDDKNSHLSSVVDGVAQ
ncbi:hypothetical protein Agabi119p4_2648 [Agaricus bisporus var. burnettii]|uniref:CxC2-like cysteine cluster KDZ transposase-associated domain-containing protein n=1 Tax=Agaricus bisporus var. burnettii TaxID=192524 RepID=A0A8H7KKD7_AGABI|nr:hypothetical protein Agabi119p4_2648 [Agaricus bisporus var. burnettii]